MCLLSERKFVPQRNRPPTTRLGSCLLAAGRTALVGVEKGEELLLNGVKTLETCRDTHALAYDSVEKKEVDFR